MMFVAIIMKTKKHQFRNPYSIKDDINGYNNPLNFFEKRHYTRKQQQRNNLRKTNKPTQKQRNKQTKIKTREIHPDIRPET